MRKFGLKTVLFSALAVSVFFSACAQPTDVDKVKSEIDKLKPGDGGGKDTGGTGPGVEVPSGSLTANVKFGNVLQDDTVTV
ncbi:MAG: hypothetical protein LBC77_04715, partial [Spirochaetaceae bacterium]|nr:hypothetical protein [Spirochaetaceae bacterium]